MDNSKPMLLKGNLNCDDRGYVYCALDRLHELGIKRCYVVENFSKGQVRAWHGHKNSDTIIHCVSGAAKIYGVKFGADYPDPIDESTSVDNILKSSIYTILNDRMPDMFFVPRGHFNGFVSLEDNTKLIVFSTDTFDDIVKDDVRLSWDHFGKDIWKIKNR